MNIAERIKNARLMRGYTQEELAEKLDMSKAQMSRYETGASLPSVDALAKIAEVLNVSADYLLGISSAIDSSTKKGLSTREQAVITLWRHGDKLEAVKVLVNEG